MASPSFGFGSELGLSKGNELDLFLIWKTTGVKGILWRVLFSECNEFIRFITKIGR